MAWQPNLPPLQFASRLSSLGGNCSGFTPGQYGWGAFYTQGLGLPAAGGKPAQQGQDHQKPGASHRAHRLSSSASRSSFSAASGSPACRASASIFSAACACQRLSQAARLLRAQAWGFCLRFVMSASVFFLALFEMATDDNASCGVLS